MVYNGILHRCVSSPFSIRWFTACICYRDNCYNLHVDRPSTDTFCCGSHTDLRGVTMPGIVINVATCRECPYLRYPWSPATHKVWACGDSFKGDERSKDEKHWLGGDALPGDRLITDVDIVQSWCAHPQRSTHASAKPIYGV